MPSQAQRVRYLYDWRGKPEIEVLGWQMSGKGTTQELARKVARIEMSSTRYCQIKPLALLIGTGKRDSSRPRVVIELHRVALHEATPPSLLVFS
jgi:hypothetical protein